MKTATGKWLWAGLLLASILGSFVVAADAPGDKDKDGDKKESNRVQYARTYVELAKLDLQIAQARNKQVADTLPPALIMVFEENVALAELWLDQEQAEAAGKPLTDSAVKMAEIRMKAAEFTYKRLQEADRISKQSPQRLERARLQVELARLNVAGAKELDASSPVELVEFEMERLREEVSELYVRQLKLLDRN
jgi:hypothetical protein